MPKYVGISAKHACHWISVIAAVVVRDNSDWDISETELSLTTAAYIFRSGLCGIMVEHSLATQKVVGSDFNR